MNQDKAHIKKTVSDLKSIFRAGKTQRIDHRISVLRNLKAVIIANESRILSALNRDLRKCETEAWMAEVNEVIREIDLAIKKIKTWSKPKRVRTPLAHQPAKSYIRSEPLGVVLVIGPWNYPFLLMMAPLIGAIAAGNCALMKPSELAPATSSLIRKLIMEELDSECIRVLEGGVKETSRVLEERFDHIFFTGGETVGRIVMKAAAEHLTPVVLELGGKSPCIVDKDVDPLLTARRICWGKFINAGQTCIAPDYLLVHKDIKPVLLEALKKEVIAFFGEDPQQSKEFTRIINHRHFDRVTSLMQSGKVAFGGGTDRSDLYIAPTILDDVEIHDPIMKEEIFGPLLPVINVDSVRQAIEFINKRPKPLALYLFSKNKLKEKQVVSQTSSGGVCINDTIMHITSPYLPFGGVGPSGMGNYHGHAGFRAFSHEKSVMSRGTAIDPDLRYPPYSPWLKRILKWI